MLDNDHWCVHRVKSVSIHCCNIAVILDKRGSPTDPFTSGFVGALEQ